LGDKPLIFEVVLSHMSSSRAPSPDAKQQVEPETVAAPSHLDARQVATGRGMGARVWR
jgi:hypothetical protein